VSDSGNRTRRSAARRGGRRGSLIGRAVRAVLSLAVLAALAVAGAAAWLRHEIARPGPLATPAVVLVERGMGAEAIARRLVEAGAVANATLFMAGVTADRLLGQGGTLKAGEYEIPAGASVTQIVALLESGKGVVHKITIPEGLTSRQILERVAANDVLVDDPPAEIAEGALLPDTYVFQRGKTRAALIAQMRKAHDQLLDELWPKRAPDLPIATRDEAVILASIVEKETGVAAERPRVAAVFINRLRKGMRLQSDPTIIYGIVGGAGRLDRPITRADISRKTAWNTYQIDGLPPTPIANPGRASLEAVLNPPATDELYFVADGTGGHAFATTLADHNANVRKWRQIEAQREDAAQTGTAQTGTAQTGTAQTGTAQTGAAAAPSPAPDTPAPDTPATEAQAEAAAQPPGPQDAATAEAAPPTPAEAAPGPGLPIPDDTPPEELASAGAPEAAATAETAPAPATAVNGDGLVEVAGRLIPLPRPKPAPP
jgi:UPF0755 protein